MKSMISDWTLNLLFFTLFFFPFPLKYLCWNENWGFSSLSHLDKNWAIAIIFFSSVLIFFVGKIGPSLISRHKFKHLVIILLFLHALLFFIRTNAQSADFSVFLSPYPLKKYDNITDIILLYREIAVTIWRYSPLSLYGTYFILQSLMQFFSGLLFYKISRMQAGFKDAFFFTLLYSFSFSYMIFASGFVESHSLLSFMHLLIIYNQLQFIRGKGSFWIGLFMIWFFSLFHIAFFVHFLPLFWIAYYGEKSGKLSRSYLLFWAYIFIAIGVCTHIQGFNLLLELKKIIEVFFSAAEHSEIFGKSDKINSLSYFFSLKALGNLTNILFFLIPAPVIFLIYSTHCNFSQKVARKKINVFSLFVLFLSFLIGKDPFIFFSMWSLIFLFAMSKDIFSSFKHGSGFNILLGLTSFSILSLFLLAYSGMKWDSYISFAPIIILNVVVILVENRKVVGHKQDFALDFYKVMPSILAFSLISSVFWIYRLNCTLKPNLYLCFRNIHSVSLISDELERNLKKGILPPDPFERDFMTEEEKENFTNYYFKIEYFAHSNRFCFDENTGKNARWHIKNVKDIYDTSQLYDDYDDIYSGVKKP